MLISGGFSDPQAHLPDRCPSFVEDQAVHVAGQIGERDLGLGALDADGADEQPHLGLLLREHVFDPGADLRLCGIPAPDMIRHRADPALRFEPLLVGLTAVGRIGPDIRCGIVVRHDVPEHPAIEAGAIGDLALADEAEDPANRDAALVAEAGDGDVDLRPEAPLGRPPPGAP